MIGSGRVARERSQTDPGHASRIPSRSPHIQASSRVPPPVFTFSTPGRDSQYVPHNHGYDSSGSELHLQTDRGRALFVTNAVIVPSSSSSSEDVETSQVSPHVRVNSPAWPSHIPQRNHPYGRRPAQSGVGLGLGTAETMGNAHSHATPRMASNGPDADIESEYNSDPADENANPLGVSSSVSSADLRSLVLNRQTSRPGPNRNGSANSRDGLPNPWDHNDSRPSEDEQRRRELIELVNEMDNGFSGPPQTYEYDDLSDDEYTGEQGLAISPSDEFHNNMHANPKVGDEIGHMRRRSPVAGQATPRPRSGVPVSAAFPEDRTEYPSPRLSSYARDQTGGTPKKNQGTDLSPLSEYSGDEDAQYVPERAVSPSQRPHTTLTRSPFKSTREGDRHLPSRESSGRTPTVGVAPLNLTRLPNRASGSGRSSERTLRASREPSTTGSFKSVSDGAHSSSKIRALNRAHGRKGTQCSPRVRDYPLPHADSSSSIESLRWQQHEDQSISVDAEAIFEQLGTRRQSVSNENSSTQSQRQGKRLDFPTNRSSKPPSPRETIFEQLGTNRQSVANENSSTLSQRQGKGPEFQTNRPSKPPSPRETIFEQLGTGRQSIANENSSTQSQRQGKGLDFPTSRSSKPPSPRETPNSHPHSNADLPNSHDLPPRAYEPQRPQGGERNSQASDAEPRTWLSTVSSSAYHSLLDRYGEVEIKRQQIIWDLCETERAFVRRLQTFVRLFICPLRMKDSVTWLTGVPPEVARLFDWLEDIINLHAQISSALRAIVSEQYPIVMRVAGRVRSFVSRLEVHQPYVVRLESATLLIKRLSGESNSDFGEFIRIQQEQDDCHGWSVEAFLVEPVNRLVDYPIHFKVRTEPPLRHPPLRPNIIV